MTMFASKTPRDLNHDPEPFISHHGRHEDADPAGWDFDVEFDYDPRPEFDHVQHNEPNPLLADLREFWPVIIEDWIAALDDPWFMDGVPDEFGVATEDHRDHAKKVLNRLAAFPSATTFSSRSYRD